jgi:hypothetical protein
MLTFCILPPEPSVELRDQSPAAALSRSTTVLSTPLVVKAFGALRSPSIVAHCAPGGIAGEHASHVMSSGLTMMWDFSTAAAGFVGSSA